MSLENGLIKLYRVWSSMVTLNKTHVAILVCAADDFRKYQKMQTLRFRKNHKKSVKVARRVCSHLNFNSIKTAFKSLIFFKNLIFVFLNPKIVK